MDVVIPRQIFDQAIADLNGGPVDRGRAIEVLQSYGQRAICYIFKTAGRDPTTGEALFAVGVEGTQTVIFRAIGDGVRHLHTLVATSASIPLGVISTAKTQRNTVVGILKKAADQVGRTHYQLGKLLKAGISVSATHATWSAPYGSTSIIT